MKSPTSMRYERVQLILENDPSFRTRLSDRTQPITTRFGEQKLFSKETVAITESLHTDGRDAHKIKKDDVLRAAVRLLHVRPTNGNAPVTGKKPHVAEQFSLPIPPKAPEPTKPKVQAEPKTRKPVAAKPQSPKATPVKSQKSKIQAAKLPAKPPAPTPVKVKARAVSAKTKKTEPGKPEAPKGASLGAPPAAVQAAPVDEAEATQEIELPPERQPLQLPPEFDPSKHPHYSVQSSIYSLILTALNVSDNYEKYPGSDERQRKLEEVSKDYLETCDALKLKAT